MRYLCMKQIPVGGVTYHPGEIIPDGVILPKRAPVLEKMGYISEIGAKELFREDGESAFIYTKEELDAILDEAIEEAVNNTIAEMEQKQDGLRMATAKLKETWSGVYDGTVEVAVKGASGGENEQVMAILAKPEEIRQAFSIMQMNAEEGAKAVADVRSENVLILLHAADSRKTIKNAAKEQADKYFLTEKVLNESGRRNESTDTNIEGADT